MIVGASPLGAERPVRAFGAAVRFGPGVDGWLRDPALGAVGVGHPEGVDPADLTDDENWQAATTSWRST